MAKLKAKNWKNSLFYEEKSLVGLTPKDTKVDWVINKGRTET
jgi:hypothetical protein